MMEEFIREPFMDAEFEIDFDFEFDAPFYYDFTQPETSLQAAEAERWFDSAQSCPPSPFDVPDEDTSICCEDMNCVDMDLDSDGSVVDDDKRGLELCNPMDQERPSSKTKFLVKSSLSRISRLMKPTLSYLAKYNQLQDVHSDQFVKRFQKMLVKMDNSSQSSSMIENEATKRQKLDAGFLNKVSLLMHESPFTHKAPEKFGDVNLVHARSKVTIPREPNLETARRAQRHRSKVNTESGEHEKSNVCTFKARPLNRKILAAPTLQLIKKGERQQPEFQVFHLRTSERAKQHASNNVETMRNYNSITQNETRGSKRLESVHSHPLNKKMLSSKGRELGVLRNIKHGYTDSMEYNFPTDNRVLHEPPIELLNKLSLVSEINTNIKSQSKVRLPTKGSKENASTSFHIENKMKKAVKRKSPRFGGEQYQCGFERRITEGEELRFSINRNLDIC